MTQYELNFSLLVEQMLSKITDPAYRQMIVEVFLLALIHFSPLQVVQTHNHDVTTEWP